MGKMEMGARWLGVPVDLPSVVTAAPWIHLMHPPQCMHPSSPSPVNAPPG